MAFTVRPMTDADVPALQKALNNDKFHPGQWTVAHFADPQAMTTVVEDKNGPAVFALFTKVLRISCVWADGENMGRNARAIITGMTDTIQKAIASGYKEIIVTTNHEPLAAFLKKFGFEQKDTEYLLALT